MNYLVDLTPRQRELTIDALRGALVDAATAGSWPMYYEIETLLAEIRNTEAS